MLVHSLFEFLASFFPICHHQNLYDMKRGETNREKKRERENVSNGSEKHQKYFIYSSKGKSGDGEGKKNVFDIFLRALLLFLTRAQYHKCEKTREGKGKKCNRNNDV